MYIPLINVRIINKALPTYSRARLFKVAAHHNHQFILEAFLGVQ